MPPQFGTPFHSPLHRTFSISFHPRSEIWNLKLVPDLRIMLLANALGVTCYANKYFEILVLHKIVLYKAFTVSGKNKIMFTLNVFE